MTQGARTPEVALKRLENQNYYQILEVPYKASWAEIQRAYELAKKTYSENAIASYSLFDVGERGRILEKVEEAYRVLSDPDKRQKYNQALHGPTESQAAPTSAPVSLLQAGDPIPEVVTGEMMKVFREKKGISLEEIAERTRININYLQYIEVNRFESLPAEVYVYSYLKQYVKIVQCEETVAEGYMKGFRAWLKAPKS